MKRIAIIAAAIALGLLTQSTSCRKTGTTECGDIACTMMFAMITVEVKDNMGRPVKLDEYYTLRDKTGEKLVMQALAADSGQYTVIDDSYINTLKNKSEQFRFVGKKNGVEVINEPYEVEGDCCHVSRKSGKTSITLP